MPSTILIYRHYLRSLLALWMVVMVVATPLSTPANNYQALTGHQVWEVEGLQPMSVVTKLEEDALVDILGHYRSMPRVRVTPESVAKVDSTLTQAGLTYRVIVHDIAKHLQEEHIREKREAQSSQEACLVDACAKPLSDNFMTFQQIEWFLHEVAKRSSRVHLESLGKSYEGRNIWRVHITPASPTPKGSAKRKAVWIEGGLHAREWISPAVAVHLIDLIAGDEASVLDDVDVFIVPVANPDGYTYTWTNNRMWRKNTHPSMLRKECAGVDLNRNWDTKFGVGASNNPCSDVYMGTEPFSEPETLALKTEMRRVGLGYDLRLVLAVHSYGQMLLYPWGWTTEPPPNKDNMEKAGKLFAKAAEEVIGSKYSVDNSAGGLYYSSGATDDWAKAELNTPYVYTLELPDKGKTGFQLPANRIKSTVQEVWRGLGAIVPVVLQ